MIVIILILNEFAEANKYTMLYRREINIKI